MHNNHVIDQHVVANPKVDRENQGPGTPLVEKQISDIAAQRRIRQKKAINELLAEKQPSLDFVSPAQLGGTVAFLCSAAADQITGTAISVDGGWTAQ
jgi:3-hydroxybutyrate dehydrogenase